MIENKKILMIIAPENFRDEEFEVPYNTFIEKGASVTVASLRKGIATGMFGAKFDVKTTLDEVDENNFDAVVFVGGAGVPEVRADKRAVEIAKNSVNHKVLAAICWAPTILAKAGSVEKKNTTVWLGDDGEYGMPTDKVMEKYGAFYSEAEVVEDGNIVTGNGPDAAEKFANAIIKKLSI
ncbi:MAG: DJ-1/PfpI family protein [bacterium]